MQNELVVGYLVLVVVVISIYFAVKYWNKVKEVLLSTMGFAILIVFLWVMWITSGSGTVTDAPGMASQEAEYYDEQERAYEDYQAEQVLEATRVQEDIDQIRRWDNVESSCNACWNKYYCNQMSSCGEAYFCMEECGLTRLDGDLNGVPCEVICGTP